MNGSAPAMAARVLGAFLREALVSHGEVVVDGAPDEVDALRHESESGAAFAVGEGASVQ